MRISDWSSDVCSSDLHPGRLKNEYERRLGILEEKEKTNPDTAALERQRLQLEKGKSRLIDSYAEGMIDKMDFDPKMRNLKSRKIGRASCRERVCKYV